MLTMHPEFANKRLFTSICIIYTGTSCTYVVFEICTVSAQLEARASIFHRGFLGGPLIKFIIPGLLIKQVDIVKCFFRYYVKYMSFGIPTLPIDNLEFTNVNFRVFPITRLIPRDLFIAFLVYF